jgi:hypothetical protein
LNRVDDKAVETIQEETGEVDVEGFLFLFGKFCLHLIHVGRDSWMVVIRISCFQIHRRADEMSQERDALGADAEASWEVRWW